MVLSDAPNQTANATVQRTRWEGGRFRLIFEHVPALFLAVLRGQSRLIEPLAELLLLPLAYHVLLLLITLAVPALTYYALAALLLVGLHVLLAISKAGDALENCKALARVPFYIVWKVLLIPKLLRNAQRTAKWQRTDRENS
jgi:hypothetical protein